MPVPGTTDLLFYFSTVLRVKHPSYRRIDRILLLLRPAYYGNRVLPWKQEQPKWIST